MGGTTMAAVSKSLSPSLANERNLLFVPARGGLGETMAIQANTICAEMAEHSGGLYRNLYVPEDISAKSVAPLLQEPVVKSVLDLINHADVVIHSIGRARTMANRRNMTSSEIDLLTRKKAVRSEERRVGKECRSRWLLDHSQQISLRMISYTDYVYYM